MYKIAYIKEGKLVKFKKGEYQKGKSLPATYNWCEPVEL
jgi:hypothetical protein